LYTLQDCEALLSKEHGLLAVFTIVCFFSIELNPQLPVGAEKVLSQREGAIGSASHRSFRRGTRRACNLYKVDQESGGKSSVENSIRRHDEQLQATDNWSRLSSHFTSPVASMDD
jgi:hypothetical protein